MKRKLSYILTAAIVTGCIFQSVGMVCAEEAAETTEVAEEAETTDSDGDPAFLEEELGDGYQTINYGLGGKTLLNEGDDPYTVHEFYTLSQELQADIYIIMLGTNDSKPYNWDADLFKTEMELFVKTYQDLPNHPEIYLATPPRAFVVEGADEEG